MPQIPFRDVNCVSEVKRVAFPPPLGQGIFHDLSEIMFRETVIVVSSDLNKKRSMPFKYSLHCVWSVNAQVIFLYNSQFKIINIQKEKYEFLIRQSFIGCCSQLDVKYINDGVTINYVFSPFKLCPNLMNLSHILNPPKTGFNWAPVEKLNTILSETNHIWAAAQIL